MTKAICEDCGSLVDAEITHNGVCEVGHYVHCGWGHMLSPSDLISGAAADRIEELETKLAKAVDVIDWALICWDDHNKHGYTMQGDWVSDARTTLAELKNPKDSMKGERDE